jgi:hypothetical protein
MDNRVLTSVNVMGSNVGEAELSKLQAIMKSHSTLQSLCGIAASATEADFSGLGNNKSHLNFTIENLTNY